MQTRRMAAAERIAELLRALADTVEEFAADPTGKLPRALLQLHLVDNHFVVGSESDVRFLFNPTCPECGEGLDNSDICTSSTCKTREAQ